MRFKLTLRPAYGSSCILPLNYQYELGAWIYRTLYEANPTFASWLHEKGYVERGKKFKLFSYSHFLFRDGDYKIFKAEQQIGVRGSFDLIISIAVDEAAIHFITGVFAQKNLQIVNKFA